MNIFFHCVVQEYQHVRRLKKVCVSVSDNYEIKHVSKNISVSSKDSFHIKVALQ